MKFKKIDNFKQHHRDGFTTPQTAYLVTETGIDYINIVLVRGSSKSNDKWEPIHLETGLATGMYMPPNTQIHQFKITTREEAVQCAIRKIKATDKEKVLDALKRYEKEGKYINKLSDFIS